MTQYWEANFESIPLHFGLFKIWTKINDYLTSVFCFLLTRHLLIHMPDINVAGVLKQD